MDLWSKVRNCIDPQRRLTSAEVGSDLFMISMALSMDPRAIGGVATLNPYMFSLPKDVFYAALCTTTRQIRSRTQYIRKPKSEKLDPRLRALIARRLACAEREVPLVLEVLESCGCSRAELNKILGLQGRRRKAR